MFRRRAKPEPPPKAPLPLETPFAEVHPEFPLDYMKASILGGFLERELERQGHRAEVVCYSDDPLRSGPYVLLVHTAAHPKRVQEVYAETLEQPQLAKQLRRARRWVLPEGNRLFTSRACTVALPVPHPLPKKAARGLPDALQAAFEEQGVLARVMTYGPFEQPTVVIRAEGDPARPAQVLAEHLAGLGLGAT